MTWIKFCGTTNLEDALKAASLGVNALGFIFAASPRRIEPDAARKIILSLPETLLKMGVFVNEEAKEVQRLTDYCGLTALQFHGKESPEYCRRFSLPVYKTIHVKNWESLTDMEKYHAVSILLDSYSPVQAGGTGNPFPWKIAIAAREKRNVILSGGLNPSNVREAIEKVRPLGVDVCSGIERVPGRKDPSKMIDFVEEVKKADETAG
jgi:phosphoribosylanthranilate isomerase